VADANDTSSGTSSSAFKLDAGRLSQTEKIVSAATLVLIVTMFLPWFGVTFLTYSATVDGLWHGYQYLTLILAIAVIAYMVLKAGFAASPVKLPVPEARALVIASSVEALLTVISFLTKPGGTSWKFGAYLGLIAAIIAVAPGIVPALSARVAKHR